VDYRLTPRKITTDLSQRYLGTENVFLVTILGLLRYPEDVIIGYISGLRKKYVNPANFYFISLTLIGLQIFILKHVAPDTLGISELGEEEDIKTFISYFYDYIGLYTTFFIPAYALTGYIVFLDSKKYNFSEHLIFSIYVFGLLNILTFLFTPFMIGFDIPYMVILLVLTPLTFLQFAWYYKRCFQLSFGQTALKSLIAVVVFQFVVSFYVLIFIAIGLGILYIMQPQIFSNVNFV
jgi:hypothetical protein